jgi:hypothetical protein
MDRALLVRNAVWTVCQERGHAGCCDNSPGRHATAHFRLAGCRLSGRTNRARTGIGATSTSSCSVPVNTVSTHIRSIDAKLQVSDRSSAVQRASLRLLAVAR